MPLMTKIRESMATVFAVFAGVFVVYIVLDWGMDITGRKHSRQANQGQEVGSVNDESIMYKDYSDLVRQLIDNQKTQSGIEPDDEQQKAIRDQVWDQIVSEHLYADEIKRLGITVSDQEIVDWVRGDNPPDFLRKQFTDSTGTFNRQAYDAAIQDPRNKSIWVRIEDALKKQRLTEKLQSVLGATVKVSDGEVMQRFLETNVRFEADYALLDAGRSAAEQGNAVSEDDLRRYYNDHSDEFKAEASRKLKYVLFREMPSKSDSEAVVTEMDDITRRAKAGADFDDLAKTYSEFQAPNSYFKHSELGSARELAIFRAKVGDIVGPIKEGDTYDLIKILDFQKGTTEFAHASHILINIENNDSASALKQAKEILASLKKGESFENLARMYSKDPGSASQGGDLGWFGKGRMVKPFEEAVFRTKPGQIVGPVRTQFGYHIIKVLDRDSREVKISDIRMTIKASAQTKNDLSQHAQDFSYLAKQGSFENEASAEKYQVSETQSFQKNAIIPGIGMNPALNRFAFSGKKGDVSEAIAIQNNFGVFMISDVRNAGIRPFDEVKANVEARVRHEKLMDKLKESAAELLKSISPTDNLRVLLTKKPDLIVEHIGPITPSGNIPGIGGDYAFIGALEAMNANDPPRMVEGLRGIYILKVTGRTPFDTAAYNQQKDNIRSQMLTEKRSRYVGEWAEQLKKSADIVDNRDLYYKQ